MAGFRSPLPLLGLSAPTGTKGYRSLLAPWLGGACAPSAARPGYRSLLALWAGGAFGYLGEPPEPEEPGGGGIARPLYRPSQPARRPLEPRKRETGPDLGRIADRQVVEPARPSVPAPALPTVPLAAMAEVAFERSARQIERGIDVQAAVRKAMEAADVQRLDRENQNRLRAAVLSALLLIYG